LLTIGASIPLDLSVTPANVGHCAFAR